MAQPKFDNDRRFKELYRENTGNNVDDAHLDVNYDERDDKSVVVVTQEPYDRRIHMKFLEGGYCQRGWLLSTGIWCETQIPLKMPVDVQPQAILHHGR